MFEWDKNKSASNKVKHGISFSDTFGVFEDTCALTINQIIREEERHITIGRDAFGRILVIVYTWRGDYIRIISARKAKQR